MNNEEQKAKLKEQKVKLEKEIAALRKKIADLNRPQIQDDINFSEVVMMCEEHVREIDRIKYVNSADVSDIYKAVMTTIFGESVSDWIQEMTATGKLL